MGRHKKGWVKPGTPEIDPELKSIVAALPQGKGKDYCWRIRVTRPGVLGTPYLGGAIPLDKLPPDALPQLIETIRRENPDVEDISVYIHDGQNPNVQVLDENGKPIKRTYPAPEKPVAQMNRAPGGLDPEFEEKKEKMERAKRDLELRKEQIRIDAQARRVDEMEAGIVSPDPSRDGRGRPGIGGGPDALWPLGPGVPFKVIPVGDGRFMPVPLDDEDGDLEDAPRGRFGSRFGGERGGRFRGRFRDEGLDGDRGGRGGQDGMIQLMIAQMNAQSQLQAQQAQQQSQVLIALLSRPERPPDNTLMQILPIMMQAMTGSQLKPETILGLYGPMMSEMSKMSNMSMKSTLDMHQAYTDRMLDQLEENGKDPDEVDKFRKYAELIKDSLQGGVQLVTGRASILQPGKAVPIPAPVGGQRALPPVKRPALGPPPTASTQTAPTAQTDPNAPVPAAPAPVDPAAGAKAKAAEARVETERRVRQFFEFAEAQMHTGGDPAPFMGDPEVDPAAKNFWSCFDLLPKKVRDTIAKGEPSAIYAVAREFIPDVVDRLEAAFKDPATGVDAAEWMESFWEDVVEAGDLAVVGEPVKARREAE